MPDSSEVAELMEEISEQLLLSREVDRRKRVENFQILLAIGILGVYFTSPAQKFITDNQIEGVTTAFLAGIGFYLITKLISLTIRSIRDFWILELYGELVLPLVFVTVVVGYLIWLVVQLISISINIQIVISRARQSALVTVILSGITGLIYAYYSYQAYKRQKAEENRIDQKISGRRFEEWIYENPEMLEEGMKIIERDAKIDGMLLDFLGEDASSRPVLIELKNRVDHSKALGLIGRLDRLSETYTEEDPRKMIASFQISDQARELLEDKNIEYVEIESVDYINRINQYQKFIEK